MFRKRHFFNLLKLKTFLKLRELISLNSARSRDKKMYKRFFVYLLKTKLANYRLEKREMIKFSLRDKQACGVSLRILHNFCLYLYMNELCLIEKVSFPTTKIISSFY